MARRRRRTVSHAPTPSLIPEGEVTIAKSVVLSLIGGLVSFKSGTVETDPARIAIARANNVPIEEILRDSARE